MPAATVAAREDNNGNEIEIEIEADKEIQDKPEELHSIKNIFLFFIQVKLHMTIIS